MIRQITIHTRGTSEEHDERVNAKAEQLNRSGDGYRIVPLPTSVHYGERGVEDTYDYFTVILRA